MGRVGLTVIWRVLFSRLYLMTASKSPRKTGDDISAIPSSWEVSRSYINQYWVDMNSKETFEIQMS